MYSQTARNKHTHTHTKHEKEKCHSNTVINHKDTAMLEIFEKGFKGLFLRILVSTRSKEIKRHKISK